MNDYTIMIHYTSRVSPSYTFLIKQRERKKERRKERNDKMQSCSNHA